MRFLTHDQYRDSVVQFGKQAIAVRLGTVIYELR